MWHIGERDERHQQGHNRPLACRGSFSSSEESSFWPAKPCGTLPGEFCLCWAHTMVVRDSNCRARRRGTATVTHVVFLLCLQIESLDAWMLSSLACGWFLETLDADGPPKYIPETKSRGTGTSWILFHCSQPPQVGWVRRGCWEAHSWGDGLWDRTRWSAPETWNKGPWPRLACGAYLGLFPWYQKELTSVIYTQWKHLKHSTIYAHASPKIKPRVMSTYGQKDGIQWCLCRQDMELSKLWLNKGWERTGNMAQQHWAEIYQSRKYYRQKMPTQLHRFVTWGS